MSGNIGANPRILQTHLLRDFFFLFCLPWIASSSEEFPGFTAFLASIG
ncbi:hypothetical protein [Klebsiella pneumoniae IS22]|nr:hypothetical protein [Klebsiella pneumoniae IS22]